MGIAETIADELTANGLRVELMPVEEVSTLAEYDAVVLGSAIYFGRWLSSAVEFVDAFLQELSERPVWLFSSGPVEEASGPASPGSNRGESPITGPLKPQDHQVFAGALDKSRLNLAERTMMRVVRADYGDFRDWEGVRAWARTIAAAMSSRDTDAG